MSAGINQCVGLHNERYFVLFMYVTRDGLAIYPHLLYLQGIPRSFHCLSSNNRIRKAIRGFGDYISGMPSLCSL
jgi:predicted transcriptional regulator with HTH domain